MEVKGSAIVPIPQFIRDNYPDGYDAWFGALSDEAQKIIKNGLTSNWYPLEAGIIEPTRKACDILKNGDKSMAWEMGRYSADKSLKGVYSIFVKAGSPGFIMNRGTKIFSSYYRPCEFIVAGHDSNSITTHILQFPEPNELIEMRIAGWMERAIELSGCRNVKASITRSLTRADTLTEILLEWQ